MDEILVRTMTLACPVEHAFRTFTDKVDLWWPKGHRKHRDGSLRFDLVEGGDLVDRASDGDEWTMARITALEPPARLDLEWYPGSPLAPTRVEIRFESAGAEATEITITHRALTLETKSIWPQRVGLFTAGWDAVLPALNAFISTED
ncbi:MAG: SRPBCC domain-containing protein [Devosia sp.]